MRIALLCLGLIACRSEKIIMVDDSISVVDQDADGVEEEEDCNDLDAAISPNVEEICDGIDNNCDGQVDEAPVSNGIAMTQIRQKIRIGLGMQMPMVMAMVTQIPYKTANG